MTLGDGKYMRLGRRIVHTHAPVGDHLHVSANESTINSRSCSDIHEGAPYGFVPDMACCSGCGYAVCSCTPLRVIDAEFSEAEAPEPPKDVLPEGWRDSVRQGRYRYLLDDGRSLIVQQQAGTRWAWCSKKEGTAPCWAGTETYREEAMAAALASVAPVEQEPALRPGWRKANSAGATDHYRMAGRRYAPFVFRTDDEELPWRVFSDSNQPTLEAAMIRAEQLAGGS